MMIPPVIPPQVSMSKSETNQRKDLISDRYTNEMVCILVLPLDTYLHVPR